MKAVKTTVTYKQQDYRVVAVVESRRCPVHHAVLVSEVAADPGGGAAPLRPERRILYCPFCRRQGDRIDV